jgi:aspartate aminotransferase-like enzyme
VVATSSTEAEYIAYMGCLKELKWVQGVLKELEYPTTLPTALWSDSQSAIALAYGEGYRARTKHIDVRYHYVREALKLGLIDLQYLPTNEMPADGLTKALSGPLWDEFVKANGLQRIQVRA